MQTMKRPLNNSPKFWKKLKGPKTRAAHVNWVEVKQAPFISKHSKVFQSCVNQKRRHEIYMNNIPICASYYKAQYNHETFDLYSAVTLNGQKFCYGWLKILKKTKNNRSEWADFWVASDWQFTILQKFRRYLILNSADSFVWFCTS